VLLRLQAKQHRNRLPRRMPCEKDSEVVGTLLPQESRTFRSNQLAKEQNQTILQEDQGAFTLQSITN
jgi:hypothetical protein